MKPCPECGGTDRYVDDDRYALLTATESPTGGTKLDIDLPQSAGFIVRLIVCRSCGHVSLVGPVGGTANPTAE